MFLPEHAARLADPDKFPRFRRTHPDGWPEGVDAIVGLTDDGKSELQSVRFDSRKYTPSSAQSWLESQKLQGAVKEAGDPYQPDAGLRMRVYGSGASARFDSADVEPGAVERRYDALTSEMTTAREDSYGFVRAQGAITRAGVFSYWREGRVVREFRPPEEVLAPESLASFVGMPLTLEHPPELLTPATVAAHQVGAVGVPTPASDHARAPLTITHPQGIKAWRNGARFLSTGYDITPVYRSGVYVRPDGVEEPFDLIQTKIIGNHVALTKTPRGGSSLRIDSEQRLDDPADTRECPIVKIKLGTSEFEIPDAAGTALNAELAKAQAVVAEANAARDKAQGRADSLEAELKRQKEAGEKSQRQDAETRAIEERAELVAVSAPILKKTIAEVSRMDSSAIMSEVLKVSEPDIDLTGKSADYMRGIFELAVKRHTRVDTADQVRRAGAGAHFHEPRTDADDKGAKEIEDAYKRMVDGQNNAWKPKTAQS